MKLCQESSAKRYSRDFDDRTEKSVVGEVIIYIFVDANRTPFIYSIN